MSSSSTKLITWQQYLSYTRLSLTFISSISNIVLPCIFSDFFPQHVPWKYLFQLPAKWQLHQRVLSGILKCFSKLLKLVGSWVVQICHWVCTFFFPRLESFSCWGLFFSSSLGGCFSHPCWLLTQVYHLLFQFFCHCVVCVDEMNSLGFKNWTAWLCDSSTNSYRNHTHILPTKVFSTLRSENILATPFSKFLDQPLRNHVEEDLQWWASLDISLTFHKFFEGFWYSRKLCRHSAGTLTNVWISEFCNCHIGFIILNW